MVQVTRELAGLVSAKPEDIAPVSSSAAGLASVLGSWQRERKPGPGQHAVLFSATAASTQRLVQEISREHGMEVDVVEVTLPIEGEEVILDALSECLQPSTSLVVLDALPADLPFLLPLDAAVSLCREKAPGAFIVADADLALLNVPLSLAGPRALPVDALVASTGAWLGAPQGAAMLYVSKEHQELVGPLQPTTTAFPEKFYDPGLLDFSAWLAVDEALSFWELVGADPARISCAYLALDAAELLSDAWGTEMTMPSELQGPMALVEVPESLQGSSVAEAEALAEKLRAEGVDVAVKAISGRLYVRVSAHVYNCIEDYELLRDAVEKLDS